MKFKDDNLVIELNDEVVNLMASYKQKSISDLEAGGILLGRIISVTHDVIIDQATEPNISDKRGRFFFKRRKEITQSIVDTVWRESEGTCIYLGEWHTHPENDPQPSGQDIVNWKRIVDVAIYNQDFLIFIIVGRKNIRMWKCNKASKIIAELFLL